MPRHRSATLACAMALVLTAAAAEAGPRQWTAGADGLSLDLSIGMLGGHGREYVLNPDGSSMSMLRWDMRNVAMFNAALAYRPLSWLKLELRAGTNLSGSSHMDDYDWNIPNCPPAPGGGTYCESNSPDTVLRNALLLDAFAAARLFSLGPVHISAIAGYKYDFYRWQATGGIANYPVGPSVTPTSFISYDQVWRAPYLGLGFEAENGRWSLRGRVIASVFTNALGKDSHHNRPTLFIDRMGPSQMAAAEIGIGYRLSPSLVLTLDYRYQAWRLATGVSTQHDGSAPPLVGDPKGAGAANTSHMVSLGLSTRPLVSAAGLDAQAFEPRWSGSYAGVEAGWAWQSATWRALSFDDPPGPPVAATAMKPLDAGAARAGLFAGYNFRLGGAWLAGLEADIGLANANHTARGVPGALDAAGLANSTDVARVVREWDASLRARLGVVLRPDLLVYATAGLALERHMARVDCKNLGGACAGQALEHEERQAATHLGWTLGVGTEVALADSWFARAEYRYSAMPTARHRFFADAPAATMDVAVARRDHRIGVGIGYRW